MPRTDERLSDLCQRLVVTFSVCVPFVAVVVLAVGGMEAATGKAPAAGPTHLSLHPYAGTALRTVDVVIAGETRPFIFDTGAGFTLIDRDEMARAGCTPFGRVAGFRADGQEVAMERCGPVRLEIGGYRTTGEVGVFDLKALLGPGAPPVAGLVAMDVFEHDAVTLDLSHDAVIVETPESLARRVASMQPVNVRIVRGAGGDVEPFIEICAQVGTLWMEIDSGNNGPVFLAPHALKQLGVTAAADARGQLDLDVVGLGTVPVTFASRAMIYDGQLNPSFLRDVVLTIDFPKGKAWARGISERAANAAQPIVMRH